MRKFLSITLIMCLILVLAACNKTPEEPSKPTEDIVPPVITPEESKTTEPKPEVEPLKWKTEEMQAPAIQQPEKEEITLTFKQTNGEDVSYNVTRLSSPLTQTQFKLDDIYEKLKESTLLQEYTTGKQRTELGHVKLYPHIGQQQSYEYTESFCATKEYNYKMEKFEDWEVVYKGDTSKYNGWHTIAIQTDIPLSTVTFELQQEVFAILKLVYGEEFAQFLCYAPANDGNSMKTEMTFETCTITLHRDMQEEGLAFSIAVNSCVETEFSEYAGDYTAMLGTPEALFRILSDKVGTCDMQDFRNIFHDVLKDNFESYTQTYPSKDSYYYRKLMADNNHTVIQFTMEALTGQEDTEEYAYAPLNIDYTTIIQGDIFTNVRGEFQICLGQVGIGVDKNAINHAFTGKGINIADYLLPDVLKFTNEFYYNNLDDYHTSLYQDVNILDIRKTIQYAIIYASTAEDTYRAYVRIVV